MIRPVAATIAFLPIVLCHKARTPVRCGGAS